MGVEEQEKPHLKAETGSGSLGFGIGPSPALHMDLHIFLKTLYTESLLLLILIFFILCFYVFNSW